MRISLALRIPLALLLLNVSQQSLALDDQEQVEKLISMLNSSAPEQRTLASQRIIGSGLTDKKLFDVINNLVEKGFTVNLRDKYHIDEIAWHTKALASSGRDEYSNTIRAVSLSEHRKLRRIGSGSIRLLEDSNRWNQIINSQEYAADGQSDQITQYLAMLHSGDFAMILRAGQLIYNNSIYDKEILELVNLTLLAHYRNINVKDKVEIQSMAWMCKVLGRSGDTTYRATLLQVEGDAPHKKIAQHARKALINMGT